MKKAISFLFVLVFIGLGVWFSFYKKSTRVAISGSGEFASTDLSIDLYQGTLDFLALAKNKNEFNSKTCSPILSKLYQDINAVNANAFDQEVVHQKYKDIIQNLFFIRVEIKNRLKEFIMAGEVSAEHECVTAVRNLNRTARFIEDYLGEMLLGIPEFVEGKHSKYPIHQDGLPANLRGEAPHLMLNPTHYQMTVRSGDIIISRGNAYTSAAISRISQVDSQFSHVALVYDLENTNRVYTIEEAIKNPKLIVLEAHIEIGSSLRSFHEYLKDGNGRNAVYRFENSKIAASAAKKMHERILKIMAERRKALRLPWVKNNDVNFNVPYDFKMNRNDNGKELFCSETASLGYQLAGVNIPMFESKMESKNDLLDKMGVQLKTTFAPGDMEIDPRFDFIGEWRDYRKVKNLRQKDAVLSAMFLWMNKMNYKFYPSGKATVKSLFGWLIRQTDINLMNVEEQIPKNMNVTLMATVQTMDTTGKVLQSFLETKEREFFQRNKRFFTYREALELLEKYRVNDFKKWQAGNKTPDFNDPSQAKPKTDFHHLFHN